MNDPWRIPEVRELTGGQTASLGSPSRILSEASGMFPEQVWFGIILQGREGLISELEDRIEFWAV